MHAAAGQPGRATEPLDFAVLETFGETGTITASQHTRLLVTWTPTRTFVSLTSARPPGWLARAATPRSCQPPGRGP